MSTAAGNQVVFTTPRGNTSVGRVVDELAVGRFNSTPQSVFVVDAGDATFRVPESEIDFD